MQRIPGTALQIRNIFCIGRNFAAHARELKNEVPDDLVVFMKPTSSLISNGESILLPAQSRQVDHEAEIVAVIGTKLKNADEKTARAAILGFCAGLDLTARDLQSKAKEKGLPWTVSKGFDTFAALGPMVPRSAFDDELPIEVSLRVNRELRQKGTSDDMIFSIPVLISRLSHLFTLDCGDVIFTGTPEGVKPLRVGDLCEVKLSEKIESSLEVDVRSV